MADYTVRVQATTEEAEKKLKRVDDRVARLEKGATININLPSANQVISTLNDVTRTLGSVSKAAFDMSRALNVGPGAVVNDLEQVFSIIKSKGEQSINVLQALGKATPTNILGTAFNTASDGALALAKSVSNVGYEVFGLTQSVGVLRQAFGGLFDETIGREIRLQQSLLQTRTTLVSTADVMRNGVRIADPYEALVALEGPIEQTLENIRRRSLDIAGTTSDAIVQVFGVVASQVGAFGGTLKDAEDLAITFSGALGTIGMSNPMLANQEIRSILTGNIDQNSVLARSLGITNEEIQRAKRSSEGLVTYLTRRLEGFTAGQKIAAQGFAGITSNIAEVREEATRSLGKPLLQPLLDSLTGVYQRLQLVFDQILGIADGLGRIGSSVFSGLMSGINAAPILESFSQRDQINVFGGVDKQVAEAAVIVQKAMDDIRPTVAAVTNEVIKAFASISSGLLNLAKGFAYFKFEELKIAAYNFANIASILNSTVIPAVTTLLNLYGQILQLPLFNYLTQVNMQLQLLERVGVLPVIRLVYYWGGIAASVKIAIGWIKTFGEIVSTVVRSVLNGVASAIQGIAGLISTVGQGIIAIVQTVVQTILTVTAAAVRQIGVSLVSIALTVQQLSPKLGPVAVVIADIGKSFINLDRTVQKAKLAFYDFGDQAKVKLDEVARAGERAAASTRTLATTIGTQLLTALGKLGTLLKTQLIGFIKFQLILFAIEKLTGVLVDAWARFNRAQNETDERTKAEIAINRLTKEYADLGDTASETAKKLKEANEAIVSDRLDTLTARIKELAPEYDKAAKALAKLQKQYKDAPPPQRSTPVVGPSLMPGVGDETGRVRGPADLDGLQQPPPITPGSTGPDIREIAAAQAKYQKLRNEYANYQREIKKIEEYYNRAKQSERDAENVQILAKERKDIEAAVGELRKEIEKELREERFRTAREVASLEQSLREEARRAERSELDRRLAQESQGLVGVRAEIAQILGDYEKGLFDAQTEAQRRQFEIAEQRENLEKSLADYKIKTEEQTAKLRKRMGEFNKQVEDYIDSQEKRRMAERLENELRIAAIRTEGFALTPQEKEVFTNTATRLGASPTGLLALLRTPGVIEQVGTPAGRTGSIESLTPWMERLLQTFSGFRTTDNNVIQQQLRGRAGALVNNEALGPALYNDAASDLQTNRFFVKKPPAPKKLEPFNDLSKMFASASAERRALGERILDIRQELNSLIDNNSTQEVINQALDALSNKNYSGLASVSEATDNLTKQKEQLDLLYKTIQQGATRIEPLSQALTDLTFTVTSAFDQFTNTRKNAVLARLKGKPGLESALQTEAAGINRLDGEIRSLFGLDLATLKQREAFFLSELEKGAKQFNAFLLGITRELIKVKQVVPLIQQTNAVAFATQLQNEAAGLPNQRQDTILQQTTELARAFVPDNPVAIRLFEAEVQIRTKLIEAQRAGLDQDVIVQESLKKYADSLRANAVELGNFEIALKDTAERIALIKDVAQSFKDGFKNVIDTAMNNGDLTEALAGLLDSVKNKVTGYFLEIATRPLQDAIEQSLMKLITVPSPEEVLDKQRDQLRDQALGIGLQQDKDRNMLLQTIANNTSPAAAAAANLTGPVAISVEPFQAAATTQADTSKAASDAAKAQTQLAQDATNTATNLRNLSNSSSGTPAKMGDFQKSLGGVTTALGGIAMGIAGIQQIGKGGTYNTLMGIAGIFGSIASIGSMFLPGGFLGGLFGKSAGGPVSAKRPYLVGETGPEIFFPENGGQVISNANTRQLVSNLNSAADPASSGSAAQALASKTAALAANQARAYTQATSPENVNFQISYQSEVINNVEYVTADQFRKGMSDSAERGKLLTLKAMQNNVGTRKRVGI